MKNEKLDGWYSTGRNYLHFDQRTSFKKASFIVKNPRKVASWNFFPFLHTILESSKVVQKEDGTLYRKKKTRPIRYAAHTDSHIYSYYASILQPL